MSSNNKSIGIYFFDWDGFNFKIEDEKFLKKVKNIVKLMDIILGGFVKI